MNTENIETILVTIIVFIQVIVFFRTYLQIRIFKNVIPETSSITVNKIFVPVREIETSAPGDILANTFNYQTVWNADENGREETSEITIIESEARGKNDVFDNILHSINTYLIKNRNAASDFNLIKDITERNADTVEEDINLTLSIPLYLGLMGTMLGIVIGLFSMSSLTLTGNPGDDPLGQGITTLLGGVKIAMIASFVGLSLTTINSGWFFKGSKSLVEANKNEFYTLIQTELLPVINQSMAATFESFQKNLFKFNGEFTGNLDKLSGIFENNFKALELQESVLSKIEKIDIATVAKYNVNVLKELQVSIEEFEKFNTYASSINSSIDISTTLVERLNELLARTENLKYIADNIDNKLEQSQSLLDFLGKHFDNLEYYKEKTTESIVQTGHQLSDVFKDLRTQIEYSSQAVKDFTVEETDLLKKALSEETELLKNALAENRTNLGNLHFLETINSEVSMFKDSTASQSERIRMLLSDVDKKLETSVNKIELISSSFRKRSIKNYLKDLFSQNGE